MYSVTNRVGRLIEAWITTPVSLDEANRQFLETRTCVNTLAATGRKVVIICDFTQVQLFAPEVSDKLLQIMRGDTPHIDRVGFWINDAQPMFNLQLQRMIREAGSPARRTFPRRMAIESWLGERLSQPERERLHAFLDERERLLATFTSSGA